MVVKSYRQWWWIRFRWLLYDVWLEPCTRRDLKTTVDTICGLILAALAIATIPFSVSWAASIS